MVNTICLDAAATLATELIGGTNVDCFARPQRVHRRPILRNRRLFRQKGDRRGGHEAGSRALCIIRTRPWPGPGTKRRGDRIHDHRFDRFRWTRWPVGRTCNVIGSATDERRYEHRRCFRCRDRIRCGADHATARSSETLKLRHSQRARHSDGSMMAISASGSQPLSAATR